MIWQNSMDATNYETVFSLSGFLNAIFNRHRHQSDSRDIGRFKGRGGHCSLPASETLGGDVILVHTFWSRHFDFAWFCKANIWHENTNILSLFFFFFFIYFRPHPYIFFNPDHDTMTFLGFRVDQEGNLLDPQTRKIIQEGIMTRHLRTGLYVQKVDLENSFESYSK